MGRLSTYPNELEEETAELRLVQGIIAVDCYGEENTYYKDQFDNEFFCKNYPKFWTDEDGIHHKTS